MGLHNSKFKKTAIVPENKTNDPKNNIPLTSNDKYGFTRQMKKPKPLNNHHKDIKLISFNQHLNNENYKNLIGQLTVQELLHLSIHGIPFEYRCYLWNTYAKKHNKSLPDHYQSVHDTQSDKIKDIQLLQGDIKRTFPSHPLFADETQEMAKKLHHILKAYSIMSTDIGYVQGLNYIGGLLLFHLSETDALAVLLSITKRNNFFNMKKIFDEKITMELFKKLQHANIISVAYATSYYVTLFAYCCEVSVCARIWDFLILLPYLMSTNMTLSVHDIITKIAIEFIRLREYEFKKLKPIEIVQKLRTWDLEESEMFQIFENILKDYEIRKNSNEQIATNGVQFKQHGMRKHHIKYKHIKNHLFFFGVVFSTSINLSFQKIGYYRLTIFVIVLAKKVSLIILYLTMVNLFALDQMIKQFVYGMLIITTNSIGWTFRLCELCEISRYHYNIIKVSFVLYQVTILFVYGILKQLDN
ncbi:TBC domain-containing protein [Reticulomyxa filosa]|uniref:TBC domain-containing protein n=1 Tax=Reticulomyxa filosa TaxID=46433 RepID=X6LJK1_RETFI|nr:TBC domain-containing protein [Reticulomyxa filosa]|eukprot:ETO02138.1 TBC domain-containing protein [Reticulomyxa filosa]